VSTVHALRKAMRGTKRTCQVCEVRFYDLARSPIVCPMCGAQYTPPAEPPIHATARAGPFAGKTGWRRQPLTRLQPALPVADIVPSDRFHAVTVDEESEETATADSESGVILDEPQHDSDVAGLVDRPN
jgi:uncharacterized protein (TIGR02300 family)